MISRTGHLRDDLIRHVLTAVVMILLAACGNDSGFVEQPRHAKKTLADEASSTAMSKDLRAAYIASIQRDAPEPYAAVATDGLVRLDNPAQRFVTTIDRHGFVVTPAARPWRFGMRTTAVGCEGAMVPVSDAMPAMEPRGVRMRRTGLQEWYLNGPLGVEQGFTLEQAPACAGHKTITMAIEGGLTATLDDADGDGRGDAVRFVDDEGQAVLAYTDLFVTDARGNPVPAWMSVTAAEVSLVVDDAAAVYPLAIDPLIGVQQAKLTASDGGATDEFGCSVAISGDTAFVGAHYHNIGANGDQGAVYVFTRTGEVWTQQQKLMADDGAAGDWFGASVAISGDTAVVGASGDDIGANGTQGSAYVFTRTGKVWTQQQKLTAGDGAASDWFGYSVAISGDTALVGAYRDGASQGSAYVFTRTSGVWTQQQKLTASDGTGGDRFGHSVALEGDTALVGAYYDDIGANQDQGSAYVFTRTSGMWTQQQKLTASDGAANDYFGYSVALSGDTALVGAYYDDIGANEHQGSAYVFTRTAGMWTLQQKLTASNGAVGDWFGNAVAIFGDTALVAAYAAYGAQGSAYVFTRTGTVWTQQQQQLLASDGAIGDSFGSSVALSDDTALVGAYYDVIVPPFSRGSAYVFVPWKDLGSACVTAMQCASGFCVDGVCCTSACGDGAPGDCQACSIAAGGAVDGKCEPAAKGTVCRAMTGACDITEICNGMTLECPVDAKFAAGIECRASAGVCDIAESCDGATNDCPADAKFAAGTECRASAGACDAAETCDGITDYCSKDAKIAAGTECRASAGTCDAAESCDGAANDCPADANAPDGTTCPDGTCTNGVCMGQGGAGGNGGAGGQAGAGGDGGNGGDGGSNPSSSGGNDPSQEGSCACRMTASSEPSRTPALGLLGLALLFARRRPRMRRN